MSLTPPTDDQPRHAARNFVPWLIGLAVVLVFASAVAVRGGNVLLLVAVLLLFVALGIAISAMGVRLSAHRLDRLQAIAPGQLVFEFQSNGTFQNAVVRLRETELINPDTLTDSERPSGGPRWASASPSALTIWKGYGAEPHFSLPWTVVSRVFAETEVRGGYGGASGRLHFPGVGIVVDGGSPAITLILRQPTARAVRGRRLLDVDDIASELDRFRAAPRSA